MLAGIEDMEAAKVTRKIAFGHIKQYDHIPVQASSLKRELGAAWDLLHGLRRFGGRTSPIGGG